MTMTTDDFRAYVNPLADEVHRLVKQCFTADVRDRLGGPAGPPRCGDVPGAALGPCCVR
jgi:hypothetical protein